MIDLQYNNTQTQLTNYQDYANVLLIANQRSNAFARVSLHTLTLVVNSQGNSTVDYYKDALQNATNDLLNFNSQLTCNTIIIFITK